MSYQFRHPQHPAKSLAHDRWSVNVGCHDLYKVRRDSITGKGHCAQEFHFGVSLSRPGTGRGGPCLLTLHPAPQLTPAHPREQPTVREGDSKPLLEIIPCLLPPFPWWQLTSQENIKTQFSQPPRKLAVSATVEQTHPYDPTILCPGIYLAEKCTSKRCTWVLSETWFVKAPIWKQPKHPYQ